MFASFFKSPEEESMKVRHNEGATILVDQAGLDAEAAYQSQVHQGIQEITKDFEVLKTRSFSLDKGLSIENILTVDEICVLSNIGNENTITGETIIASLSKTHSEFKEMLDMGCAWFADELAKIESAAIHLPQSLDALVEKGALSEEAPQSSNTMRM
jgi:hypothetical protein